LTAFIFWFVFGQACLEAKQLMACLEAKQLMACLEAKQLMACLELPSESEWTEGIW